MMSEAKHVAIILDGNRRFAKKMLIAPWKGHMQGKKKVEELLGYAQELGMQEVTLYVLSSDNIKKRSTKELSYLYRLFQKTFEEMDRTDLSKRGIRFRFIGNLSLLPAHLCNACLLLQNETTYNTNFIVTVAIAYGGREEIVAAIKKMITHKVLADEVNEETVAQYLYASSEPDMIIRTGGEKRMSNFLPWQSIYSEWFFVDKFWPEFEKKDFVACLEEFKKRKRNFGN